MIKDFIKKYIPFFTLISLGVTVLSYIIYILSVYFTPVADFINSTIGTFLRVIMEMTTHLLPFSVFEWMIILFIPAVILVIILAVRDKRDTVDKIRTATALVGVVGIIYSGYLLTMAVAYRTTPLTTHLGIEDRRDITEEELYNSVRYTVERINELAPGISRDEDGISVMDHSFADTAKSISETYAELSSRYPFYFSHPTQAKPIIFSGVMSDMGISGIYTYFTGESNINVEYPDYSNTFVIAHEFAHQRGIMRENEANFMAFLVTTESPDPFIRYSGYLNMYVYLSNALYSKNKELYTAIRSTLDEGARRDVARSSEITRAHSESPLNQFFESLNDSYLQSNGTPGVISYSYVVRITVAYYKSEGIID